MSNRRDGTSDEARARAEARFEKAQKADRENEAARAETRARAKAVDEKTARLKALRLARDAAEAEAKREAAESRPQKKAPARKKG